MKEEQVKKQILESDDTQIREWAKRDIEAASAILNMIRVSPDIMELVIDKIVEKTKAVREQETKNPSEDAGS